MSKREEPIGDGSQGAVAAEYHRGVRAGLDPLRVNLIGRLKVRIDLISLAAQSARDQRRPDSGAAAAGDRIGEKKNVAQGL